MVIMRTINKLIVHCSDTPNDRFVSVDDIRKWHVEENGWSDIGYHYVIYRNGDVKQGRSVSIIGAHCRGQNKDSIGVCLIGRDDFTPYQKQALNNLYTTLDGCYPSLKIFGHRDFTDTKTCPNFDVKDVIK